MAGEIDREVQGEEVGENKWTEHNKAIDKLWSDKHAATVQHRLGTIAVHKDSYTFHSLEARAYKHLLFIVVFS